ncbi:MAG: BREX-1 system adenine-specific DNA-methyltransferase PglX [Oscillibacter sp.]|nr:BREX-1 system adenine-specific DNA-methyltransferase PglX [Oscillibacter sp.]
MNKTAIKSFSVWARNKLLDDIRYRAGLLGVTENGIQAALPQSTKDTEFYAIGTAEPYSVSGEALHQRRKLVSAIRGKEQRSDYQTAYQCIVEEAAYTWFNRLIAVRFMEVNDYLPSHIRVLSSDSGKLEPDLVTTPFDAGLAFTPEEEQTVLRLKQDNQIDELFRLLFIKQCNALNEILPGLFEKTSDYTELLLSVSVTDRDGVVYRLTHDIDEDDFNIEKGGQVEIIGWLYQYWNTEPKDAVFGRPSGQKIKKEEIPAATQLFTPDWIVRYMVENSLGRLWAEGHPDSGLKAGWSYYLEEAEQEPAVQAQLAEIRREYAALTPEDLRCIDPCMGSGHILCYLFDVLMQIYESQGYSGRDAAQSIVRHNLYGLDIDKRATQLAYFSVMMKARQYDRRFFSRNLQPKVYCTAWDEEGENFGSLVMVDGPGEMPEDPQTVFELADYERRLNIWNYRCLLAQKYHVVVTNPPYMGGAGMNGKLAEFVKKNFPDSKADLFAVFIERGNQMVKTCGYNCMVTMQSWMFLSSFEKMRIKIMQSRDITALMHMENMVMGIAFGTAVTVFRNGHLPGYKGTYNHIKLENIEKDKPKEFPVPGNRFAQVSADKFSKIPGAPMAYWVTDNVRDLFQYDALGTQTLSDGQNKTGNNDRFMRSWWEVTDYYIGPEKKWVLCARGGAYRKWYGNIEEIIDWSEDARRHYHQDHVARIIPQYIWYKLGFTWSRITSYKPSFRLQPNTMLFEMTGLTLFVNEMDKLPYILGLMNSKVTEYLLGIITQVMTIQLRDVQTIPVKYEQTHFPVCTSITYKNIEISRADWDSFETSWDFTRHPLVRGAGTVEEAFRQWEAECAERFTRLKANEEELNRIFIDIYGLQDELTPEVEDRDVTVRKADLGRDVRSLLSYAVGCLFGRYSLDVPGLACAGGEWDASRYSTFLPDADGILPITDEDYLDDDIVGLLCAWLKAVYGPDTLEENLDFIAGALGNRGATSREVIRNYFLKDFFADHCRIYQKRPIYWLFDSGRQNGFRALVYLHRCTPDTVGNVRIDYLHRMQRVYESEIERMQDMIDHSKNPREVAVSARRREKLQKQLKECREYDGKISHLALSRIELDLDDGVKVNYRRIQTASDGKFYEVLADSRNIMGKK